MQAEMNARTMAIDPSMDTAAAAPLGMRELRDHEVQAVSGGSPVVIAGIAVLFIAGVAYGAVRAHKEHCG